MERPTDKKIKDVKITMEGVIGQTPGQKDKGIPEINYTLVRLNGGKQKYLAITEEGSDETKLIEVKDKEEAGELMIDDIGEKLNPPITR